MGNNSDSQKENHHKSEFELDWISIVIIIISLLLIGISFFANSFYNTANYSKCSSYIGSTVNGIMSPYIAIAGVFGTFLAFYIQFLAKKRQREQFNIQLEKKQKTILHISI